MVDGQLQVDSAHIEENNFGNKRNSDAFVHFVCVENRKFAASVGHYSKAFKRKIFYSDKHLVSYLQDWGYTIEVPFFLSVFNHVSRK